MKKLLYSLDDFGLTLSETLAVTQDVDPKSIARVSVIVGFNNIAPYRSWLDSVPAIDIHLNATEKPKHMGDSSFSRRSGFIFEFIKSGFDVVRIENEWRKQIQEFHSVMGRMPSGINSHEHIHLYPPLFKRVCSLAKEFTIPYIRLGRVPIREWGLRGILQQIFHKENLKTLSENRLATSSALWSADGRLSRYENRLPEGCEVILHATISGDRKVLGLPELDPAETL